MFRHLYIHTPFCTSKCAYCAFYSETGADEAKVSAWLSKLKKDFELRLNECGVLKSVYIGGGTPSSLPPEIMRELFSSIKAKFTLESNAEISVECNPESLTEEKASILASFANRISLGLQSSRQDFRDRLGRKGSAEAFDNALKLLRKAGIKNIGADLIYAIPGQSLDDWKNELKKTAESGITHISAYSLTIEEGSRLAEAGTAIPSDELSAEMWEAAGEILAQYGFNRYEVSNYAKEGFSCVHNSSIWRGESYLGCGPAAASFDGDQRFTQQSNLSDWLAGAEPEIDHISQDERDREVFVIGLRAKAGWTVDSFKQARDIDFNIWKDKLNFLAEEELLAYDGNSVSPTEKGMLFWNSLAEELI